MAGRIARSKRQKGKEELLRPKCRELVWIARLDAKRRQKSLLPCFNEITIIIELEWFTGWAYAWECFVPSVGHHHLWTICACGARGMRSSKWASVKQWVGTPLFSNLVKLMQ